MYEPKVGDVLVEVWGYDQTNVDFYRVKGVSKSKKSVRIVPIGQKFVSRNGVFGDQVLPDPDVLPTYHFKIKNLRRGDLKRVAWWGDRYSVRMSSYSDARLWLPEDGAKYQTDVLFGH